MDKSRRSSLLRRPIFKLFLLASLTLYGGIQFAAHHQRLPPLSSIGPIKHDGTIPDLVCGSTWSKAQLSLQRAQKSPVGKPIVWTVSGGEEYRAFLKPILAQWLSIGLSPVLVIALDEATASFVCTLGYQAIYWDEPQTSYSRVGDSKFEVAATLAEVGHNAFFMELDVFCKENPLPLFLDEGIVVSGHGFADFVPNIGQYYVQATKQTSNFFRSLRAVLSYSKDNSGFEVQPGGRSRTFFDQHQFYRCFPPTNPLDVHYNTSHGMYLKNKPNHNLLAICRNVTHTSPFPWRTVSSTYISAHSPPIVFDSTICIHPLSDMPFTSFRLKLATAKFMGYDPEPIHSGDRFLSTLSGDLTFNECWSEVLSFLENDFPHLMNQQRIVALSLAHLIYLAKESGRTLVPPRYLRDQNVFAAPILSLVDARVIERYVKYRYLSSSSLLSTGSSRMTKSVITIHSTQEYPINTLVQKIRSDDAQVVRLEFFCNVYDPKKQENVAGEIQHIANDLLSICMTDGRAKFVKGIGGWSKLCDSLGQ